MNTIAIDGEFTDTYFINLKQIFWQKRTSYFVTMLGSTLEYYDSALYVYMSPLLVNLFLPEVDAIYAFLLIFAVQPLTLLFRPLGAYALGFVGDKYGRKKALRLSILGMATVTGMIGLLPTYHQVGIFAPLLFAFLRMWQGFFIAGDYNGVAIYNLEHTPPKAQSLISGIYSSFTSIGILMASFMATVVSYLSIDYWRIPYLFGVCTGLVSFFIRKKVIESPEFLKNDSKLKSVPLSIKAYKSQIGITILISACFSGLYYIPGIFLNSYVPLVTDFSLSLIMAINTATLFLFVAVLPFFGVLADRYSPSKLMKIAAFFCIVLSFPLFSLLHFKTYIAVIMIKVGFTLITACFVAPFHAWVQPLFPTRIRYRVISVCYSLGTLFGVMTPAICMWLWKQTQVVEIPSVILIIWGSLAYFGISWAAKKTLNTKEETLNVFQQAA